MTTALRPPDPPDSIPFCDASAILELAYDLSLHFIVFFRVPELGEHSGIPRHVLEAHREQGVMTLVFDPEYHESQHPVLSPEHFGVELFFDTLYHCELPWKSIMAIQLTPSTPPELPVPEELPQAPGSHLKLV